jgi:hypothetical protein
MTAPDSTSPPASAATDDATPPDLGDAGKKAIDRMKAERDEARREAKANADAAKRLQAIEDSQKSEQERAAQAQQQAQARADQAEARALRLEVAFDKGLTPAQAKRLVGSSKDELEADAEEIKRDFPVASSTPPTPRPDPSQGPRGGKAAPGDEGRAQAARRFGSKQ